MPVHFNDEIVVIGGGLMGSSAAWALSKEGVNVHLIEQQDETYTQGSSFGNARISRNLGPPGDIFAFIQDHAIHEAQELIDFLNSTDNQRHSMEDIYSTSPVTYIFHSPDEVKELLSNQEIRIEYAASPAEALEKFNLHIPSGIQVIREHRYCSGTINPKALISKLHKAIRLKGNSVSYGSTISHLEEDDGGFRLKIQNKKDVHVAKFRKVIVAAGPYSPFILKEIAPYFSEIIRPVHLNLCFFQIREERFRELTPKEKKQLTESYPIIDLGEDIFYSMIEEFSATGNPLIKVGGHLKRHDAEHPDHVWGKTVLPDEREWGRQQTLTYLANIGLAITDDALENINDYACMYSLSPDETPYVSQVINIQGDTLDNLVAMAGMSGIGAKGALTYGRIASDILLGRSDPSVLYLKARKEMGADRLREDIRNRNGGIVRNYKWH